VRITPLTDRDVREALASVEIPYDEAIERLLGRISQLIEELPWLCGMKADIFRDDTATSQRVALSDGVRIALCP
jgi:hypothetical protein